jgi:hypothetical protein
MNQSEKEYLLRGRTMSITSRIETSIIHILLIANIANTRNELIELKGLKLDDKINKARCLLREFHPQIFMAANPILKRYKKIKAFRNRMAHCFFQWDGDSMESFTLWDISEDKQSGDYLHPVKYTLKEAEIEMDNLLKLADELAQLNETVMTDGGGYAELFTIQLQANPQKNRPNAH